MSGSGGADVPVEPELHQALGPEFQEVGYSLLRFDESRRPVYRALERRGE